MIEGASKSQAQVVFGVVQDPRWNKRVRVTLVATGIPPREARATIEADEAVASPGVPIGANGNLEALGTRHTFEENGYQAPEFPNMRKVA